MTAESRARSIAVLGGGFLGLNLTRLLARAGHHVTLYEASPHPGGVSASFPLADRVVDRFYHTILPGDRRLVSLIEEVGLGHALSWRTTRTGFYDGAAIHSVSNVVEFLRFPVLSPLDRLRLGWALFRAQRNVQVEDIAHLTCAEWLRATCGRTVYERLWEPLLRAKLGDAAPGVSASFIWATINRLQDAKSGDQVQNKDRMGFLKGGYAVLLDRLVHDLEASSATIRTSAAVTRLTRVDESAGTRWRVSAGGMNAEHDVVVSTLPPALLARITEGVPLDALRERPVEYLGVIVEVLLLPTPLSPFYILNLADPALPFTGIIEMTNLAPPGYFGSRGLVYLPRYLAPGDPWTERSDAEIARAFHDALWRVFPGFDPRTIVASSIQRAPFVQPIHGLDFPSRMPPSKVGPGLWVASSSQVYPWPVNNDRVLERAILVAAEVAEELLAAPPHVAPEPRYVSRG